MKLSVWLQRLLLSFALFSGGVFAADLPTVNINTADAQTLASVLTGVGQVRAEEIVKWRKTNGAFKSADQLADVKGIGATLLEKNRQRIVLE